MMIKKNMLRFIIFVIALGVSSCKDNGKEVKFDIEDIPSIQLFAEDLNFDKGDDPMLYYVACDSLVLVSNWKGRPYFLELYSLKHHSLKAKFMEQGKGPNEFLSRYMSIRSNTNQLITFDIIKRIGAKYCIDSVLLFGNEYHPPLFKVPSFIGNDIALLDKDTLIIFNKYYLSDKRFSNDISPLYSFSINSSEGNFESVAENMKFFTHNVTDGFTAVHPTDDIVWLIYQNENRIEIYNKSLSLQKTLLGPKDFTPEYEIRDGLGNHVSFKHSTRTYWHYFYNPNHMYIIYYGEYKGQMSNPVNVIKFSWDGSPIQRFELDRYLYTLYVDSQEEYIYGTEYIPGELPKLIRYNIAE